MVSEQHQQIENLIRTMGAGIGQAGDDSMTPEERMLAGRAGMEAMAQPVSNFPDVTITDVDAGGVKAEWVIAKEGANTANRILYIHGGAFSMGSPATHRPITSKLATETGCAVLSVDYRMLPEHPRQAGIDDSNTAYDWLCENGPEGPSTAEKIFISGDSAGGNLTLSVVLSLKDSDRRQCDAAVPIAPLTDATMVSETWITNAETDALLGAGVAALKDVPVEERGNLQAEMWGMSDLTDPAVSPLHGDLSNLPPLLVHASETECLWGDAVAFVDKAKGAGSNVEFYHKPGLMHVWHAFSPNVPESVEALENIGAFINSHK